MGSAVNLPDFFPNNDDLDKSGEVDDAFTDDEDAEHPDQLTEVEKRRAQRAIFEAWFSREATSITTKELKDAQADADGYALSVRNILAQQESTVIATAPREYQIELFERAKAENTIAVLDTGSGKTLIAVLLLKHVIGQELEDRAAGKAPRIAFFLVDSVTLVFQQFAVLECNLDHSVDRFCGAMGTDLWSKQTWDKHFEKNRIIVCTAEVLLQCLMHSFITMDRINLLIFDEAHHAKKNHAYAREVLAIIKDFYLTKDKASLRPRILGMTASPVDAKVDVHQAAEDLETLLHSHIATTSDIALLRKTVHRPDEQVALYSRLLAPFETTLYQLLHAKYADVSVFKKLFDFAEQASSELGRWPAELYWSFALADKEAQKVEMKVERLFHRDSKGASTAVLDAEIARLREARTIVESYEFGSCRPDTADVSNKVLKLHGWLQQYFGAASDSKCIVFVEKRHTARLLERVFSQIGGPHLRTGVLVGARSSKEGDLRTSHRQQVLTLLRFRQDKLNCLFATSVAEEGLDIPDCNLVVRFDLYRTMIQYVQSRGRARHKNSKYLHMVEDGNSVHMRRLLDVRNDESLMRRFCESLPEDRLLRGNDFDFDKAIAKERGRPTYTEASTGAKLTYGLSLAVLAHFVGSLPHNSESSPQAVYHVTAQAGKFICEVVLPEDSPVRSVTGKPQTRKSTAKQSAAFFACIALRKARHLDENLLPVYTKRLPAMRNALLAIHSKKANQYTMRLKPSLWEQLRGSMPEKMFLTVIHFSEGLQRPHQPLALLTRTQLPAFPIFPLCLSSGQRTQVETSSVKLAMVVNFEMVSQLTTFLLRIFEDVFNKTYEKNPEMMPYWLAPLRNTEITESLSQTNPVELIDWDVLRMVTDNEEYKWTPAMEPQFLADKFLVDRWDGGRRFFSVDVAPELRPLDPVPANTAPGRYMQNILDYTVSLFKSSRAKAQWSLDQPVVEAEKILHRRNWLAEAEPKEKQDTQRCFVCPEPLKISTLPVKVVVTSLVFPAVIHRLESYLIALEACQTVGLKVYTALALEAVSKDSDNTDDHTGEKINFQRGMGNNYERLEFLGDCFLKMATSISLFSQNPDDDEFEFHVKRMCMICNQNLYNTAIEMKLYEFIRSKAFTRRTWYPTGIKLLKGKGFNKSDNDIWTHFLGDKTIADVCEAMIGAAFLTYDRPGAFGPTDFDSAVHTVTTLVRSPNHTMQKWNDYSAAYTKPRYQTADSTASQRDLAAKVEQEHEYSFRYPRLLYSAFVHPSIPFHTYQVPCYQRLEFLGDSLLDMVSITHLFYRFLDKDPQWLTEHKMAMVSNKFLGALCVKLGFHRHLRCENDVILSSIRSWVTEINEANVEAQGARDYWTAVREPPKCLPDIVEAYVGAVFIDSDFNYSEVQRFFDHHVLWFFEDMRIYDTFANKHPITLLHNRLTTNFGCREHAIFAKERPSVDGSPTQVLAAVFVHGEVVAEGLAASSRYAKLKASKQALDVLHGLAPFEFKQRYDCHCVAVQDDLSNSDVVEDSIGTAI